MRICIIYLCFISCSLFAQDLVIEEAQIACIKKQQSNEPLQSAYRYGVELIIKNTSQKAITLLTTINTRVVITEKDTYQISLKYDEIKRGDRVLIPTVESLGLVTLQPNDITLVSSQFSYEKMLDKANVELISNEVYQGRFNHWQGRLNALNIKPFVLYQCK